MVTKIPAIAITILAEGARTATLDSRVERGRRLRKLSRACIAASTHANPLILPRGIAPPPFIVTIRTLELALSFFSCLPLDVLASMRSHEVA